MPTVKRIVCLANSRKLNRYCVAGKEWASSRTGDWVRPVSGKPHGEVDTLDMLYERGGVPRLLDIMDVPLSKPTPKDHQSENWLISQGRWGRRGRVGWSQLGSLVDPVAPLWLDGQSTYHGLNDEISLTDVKGLRSSLRLIHVDELTLRVLRPGAAFGNPKLRVQGRFEHHGTPYWLWVTDPFFEDAYRAKGEGMYDVGECYLTVSIGEPFEEKNACYKLIAAIIQRNGLGT